MKALSVLLGLACVSTALAREHVVFGNKDGPPVHSRHFRVKRTDQPNDVVSQFNLNAATVQYNTDKGKIFHSTGPNPDISSIMEIYIPIEAAGKSCQLRFKLPGGATLTPAGSAVKVYQLNGAPVASGPWGTGPRLTPELGTLTVNAPPVDSSGVIPIDCGAYAGNRMVFEFVADGVANIEWNDDLGGPYIKVMP